MTDENVTSAIQDGDEVDDKETIENTEKIATEKEPKDNNQPNQAKQRSVSFNRDVHVKRFGKSRESRSGSSEPTIRKEPFTHLSEKELIEEANKVIAQAESVTCTADHPPEKFFSLPYRRKFKPETSPGRRNSDDLTAEVESKSTKTPLGRSTSDVNPKKRTKERTSLSTLFRRAQRNKSPETPIVVATKPITTVKRSKSDVSDLKSNTTLTAQPKPIRKRSGSETEEFLKSLRNNKTQLSPIIESSPREDYFKKTPPLEIHQKQKLFDKDNSNSENNNSQHSSDINNKKVNPIEKPPRHKIPAEPKPPLRTKRGKSAEKEKKEQSPPISDTPKRKTEVKKSLLVDEIDSKTKDITEVKEKIKEQIRKIHDNIYGNKEMIHSSQQPPDKPPLTRGHTVGHMVRKLKEDQQSTTPKTHIISPPNNGTNNNQPFSYLKPSVSPDPNLYVRSTSPDRPPSPVNKMNTIKGDVYAQVVRGGHNEYRINNFGKQAIHKTYSPINDKIGNISDEDEGLGYEDQKNKFSVNITNGDDFKNANHSSENFTVLDSPIKPRFREYKLKSFEDFEPTYSNEYPDKIDGSRDFIDGAIRGRADGMDSKRKNYTEPETTKIDINFNELTHRRQLLESRLNARRFDRNRSSTAEPISRYLAETDPIYEAEKKMKATEKYVNDTARYYRRTLEREEFAESSVTDDYNKSALHDNRVKYNAETKTFEKISKDEVNRREFLDTLRNGGTSHFKDEEKLFPPEPEYEPPSLDSHAGKPVLTPDEYTEKKYKVKSRHFASSHDMSQSGQKYSKNKDDWFGKRKGHYASNPEIAQEREDYYANIRPDQRHPESYHNSLRRNRDYKDKYYGHDNIRRHDSGDSRDYAYRDDRSPRRFDVDSRLVDSGIENDFRKDSSGEIHKSTPGYTIHESDEDVRNTSMLLASERRHTEENYPSEQIYANGEYITRFEDFRHNDYPPKSYIPREHSADDGSQFDPRVDRMENSPNRYDGKVSSKPPKAVKKLSGLEKMKQLFSRDSSKKSKKEKEAIQSTKTRTRVLKSPEHLARDDPEYRRYRDPEPSDDDLKRKEYDLKNSDPESHYRRDYERYNDYKESDTGKKYKDRDLRDSDPEKYKETERVERRRYERDLKEGKRYKEERKEDTLRRYKEYTGSSEDRDSDHRSPKPSYIERDLKSSRETSRKSRSKTADPLDSPALAERYRGRRRLATPSPTPSPPPAPRATGWFKSLDRLSRKKPINKVEKENVIVTTEDESVTHNKTLSKNKQTLSPPKNLRFFGDTDPESDAYTKNYTKPKSISNKHSTLRKTISNSSTGIDEIDHSELTNKSYSLSNIHKQSKREESPVRAHKRNLHNISEINSNSETESHFDRKPPISPYDRRSRSHSSSKNVKTRARTESKAEERGSSSELRGSRQELARDVKHRRRTPGGNSGGSSTEGESSRQSQRSVVYLHATTVGDIPDPGALARNRSRDDVSSVNSSQLQVRTTTKSFSIFAPWTPRHHDNDVHYAQRARRTKSRDKETPKRIPLNRNLIEEKPTLQKNKSYSQTTLTKRPQNNNRLSASSTTLYRKSDKRSVENLAKPMTLARSKNVSKDTNKKSQSSEVLHREGREKVARSISMPKDKDKKSGWFKLSNKNKKTDINTRVR